VQAAPMERIWKGLSGRDIEFWHIFSAESLTSARDFSLHYRISYKVACDFTGELHSLLGIVFYPTIILIDKEGKIIHNGYIKRLPRLKKLLKKFYSPSFNQVYVAKPSFKKESPQLWHNIEEFALSKDPDNNIWIAWSKQKDGRSCVFVSKWEGKDSKPKEVTLALPGNHFAPALHFARGALWVVWSGEEGDKYSIYSAILKGEEISINTIPDTEKNLIYQGDRMRPSIATDEEGRPWVVWYRWEPVWKARHPGQLRRTRNKNIYASFWNDSSWSLPQRITPPPEDIKNDDSTDPVLHLDKEGRLWFIWSCDYHPEVHPKPLVTKKGPTILGRFWHKGNFSPFIPISSIQGKDFKEAYHLYPAVASTEGQVWIAWDSFSPQVGRRVVEINYWQEGKSGKPEIISSSTSMTPQLLVTKDGSLWVFWSELVEGFWQIFYRVYSNGIWQEPKRITFEDGDSLYPEAIEDAENKVLVFWIFYPAEREGSILIYKYLENT